MQETLKAIKQIEHLLHLHSCEQEGIQSGMPTADEWFHAVKEAHEGIEQIKKESDNKKLMEGKLLVSDLWNELKEPEWFTTWVEYKSMDEIKMLNMSQAEKSACEQFKEAQSKLIWKFEMLTDTTYLYVQGKMAVKVIFNNGFYVEIWDDNTNVQEFYRLTTRQDLKDVVRMYNSRIEEPKNYEYWENADISKSELDKQMQEYESKKINL